MKTFYRVKIIVKLLLLRSDLYKYCFITGMLIISGITELYAQPEINYAVHANIIFRFTKYINWPQSRKYGDFVIGVAGNTSLYNELKTFTANKTVGVQKIVIQKFLPTESSFNCHILFVGTESNRILKKIAAFTAGTPVLLVSESDGFASIGSCINFTLLDEHLKLEINKNSIQQRNLDIASELLQLGIIVK